MLKASLPTVLPIDYCANVLPPDKPLFAPVGPGGDDTTITIMVNGETRTITVRELRALLFKE